MSSPHSGYPHQHQGATYYQPSPPPTHVYGTHSPGPGHSPGPMSYNPYMHYPPPHMNHHHPHQQTPGRVNGGPRGGAGGSYPGNRNGHAHPHMYHQNYHHGHPPPPVPPPGPGPPPGPQSYGPHPGHHPHHPLLHAPHPQHPHSPHLAAKFGPLHPHTYSHTPPYPYPSPTSAGPYSPSWQPQQPQSPLPKQLSMPPPRGFSPAYYEPPQPQAPPAPPQPPPPQISPTRSSPLTQAMTMPGGDAPSVVIPAAAVHISKPVPSPISVVEFVPRQLQQQRAEAAAAAAAAIKAAEVEAEQRVEGAASDENLVSSQVEAPVDVEQASSSAEETHPVPEPTVNESTASTIIEAAAAITVDDSSLSALTTAPTAPPMSTNTITSTSPTALATTTYTMGTISHSSIPLSPAYSTISISSSSKPTHHHRKSSSHQSTASNIAIWSRRPGDPSKAPGIIISPRAKPPSDIVEKALDSRTPPLSPTIPSTSLPSEGIALKPSKILLEKGGVGEKQDDADVPAVQVALKHQHRVQMQQQSRQMINEEVAAVESENVTEVTEVTEGVLTIPGSPASTSTSLSIAAAAGVKDAAVAPAPVGADATNSAAVVEDAQPSAGVSVTGAAPVESTSTASVDVAEPSSTTTTLTGSTTTTTTTTTPAPAPPKAGPPKSWASLFASSSSPSSSSAAGQRSALPTSSVVGISIPAPSAPVAPPIPVVSGKKTELLNLLTNGPGGAGAAQKPQQPEKIRTRGLINSGNMCFANAVLQVLVYCSPFQRLFIELGKLLGSHNAGASGSGVGGLNTAAASGGTSTVVNGVTVTQLNDPPHLTGVGNANGKQTKSQTPFIDATVEFLKEFIEDERDNNKRKKGGSGFSLQPTKKGKEREIFSANDFDDVEGGEDKDEWPESFLPSYVYDAMKEKKRFESMRGGQQEDAEEFLGFYLDTLEEELLHIQNSLAPPPPSVKPGPAKQAPVEEKEEPEPPEEDGWLEVGKKNRTIVTRTIKAVESPITRIFGGKFKSTLKAPGQKDSVLVEDWRSLRLDIQRDAIHTIQDALTYITHPQPIQMTHPARPGVTIDASQRVLIDALPPVLVLHVKRFCYDTTVGGVVKVMKQVRFEPELEIGSDMMAPTGKRPQPTRYRLFGAIYHHGHSASGGHYTLDILHPNRYPGAKIREGWVRIDDELVSDVRAEDVFDAWEKEKDEMRNAYLLFYRRIRSV